MLSLRRLAARLTVIVPLAALFAVACEHSPSAPGVPATITVTRNPDTLAVTTSKQFIAIARDADGNVVGINPTWSVAAGGGTISSSGLFTAAAAIGTFDNTVKASVGSLSGTATVTVTAGPLASITVTPTPTTLAINGTQQFTAVGKDAGGNTVAISPVWSAAGGGSISSTGLFTAGTLPGTYANTVMATSGGIVGNATVTVVAGPLATISVTPNPTLLAVGTTQQLTAVGRDVAGNSVPITPVWSVVAGGGTVSASGLFTAGGTPGTFANTARATSGGLSGTATVTVTAGPLASITVAPDPSSVEVGATQQFTAVGRDAGGNVVNFIPTWSVVTGGGSVSDNGLFTAGTVSGTFANTIQASFEGLTGTATVTVTPGPLASITVTPDPTTLSVGLTRLFTAVGRDANGNLVAITPTWSIEAGGGAINSSSGLFTAGSTPGTYTNTVQAAVDGMTGTATVIVTAGALASITVTPTPATMSIGSTEQFTAVGKDAGGNVVAITPTWAVVAGGGSVDLTTGLFTAGNLTGTYTNTVRASVGALAGFATVNVTSGALATITVSPTPVSVQTNGTQQFTAIGRDGSGNEFLITPTWSVVSGGGSINSSTGLFTAGITAGTFNNTVRATSGGVSGFATVTVTAVAPTLASIEVQPNPTALVVGGAQQFAAVGRDGLGNIFPISPVWSVVNPASGVINASTGLFTAGASTGTFTKTVVATSGLIADSATVTVTATPPSLATIEVQPDPAAVVVGGVQQFAAVGYDGLGNIISISPVWSVVNGGGVIDGNTGVFTAGASTGTFTKTVVATSGLIADSATVTVTATPPSLATIEVQPDPANVLTNGTQQFSAVGRDGDGNVLPISPVWSVVNGGGSINAVTGLFTAGAFTGTFTRTVVATSGLIADSATVVVAAVPPPPPASPLGRAATYGILAGQGITCAISGTVNGSAADIGSWPLAVYTGFSPETTCTYTGSIPLPEIVALAQGDLTTAFNEAKGKTCDVDLTGFDLGFYDGSTPAKTLEGDKVYCFDTSAGLTGTLKLTGSAAAKWTFQVGSTLTSAAGAENQVVLAGGAIPDNVYWVVGSSATLGTSSTFQGTIMALASITLNNGATLLGRALARNGAVDMTAGAATITRP